MADDLRSLRSEQYVGTAELAEAAAQLLGKLVPTQEKGSVAELPDERTVRYYLSEGLISPATERRGTASVFGYRHLLQLLAIKRLQTEYLPIRKIKELIEGKNEEELEHLLGVGSEAASHPPARYLQELLPSQSLSTSPPYLAASFFRSAPPESSWTMRESVKRLADRWTRVKVEPGLELHIREDYELPEGRERRRLARRLLQTMTEVLTRRSTRSTDDSDRE